MSTFLEKLAQRLCSLHSLDSVGIADYDGSATIGNDEAAAFAAFMVTQLEPVGTNLQLGTLKDFSWSAARQSYVICHSQALITLEAGNRKLNAETLEPLHQLELVEPSPPATSPSGQHKTREITKLEAVQQESQAGSESGSFFSVDLEEHELDADLWDAIMVPADDLNDNTPKPMPARRDRQPDRHNTPSMELSKDIYKKQLLLSKSSPENPQAGVFIGELNELNLPTLLSFLYQGRRSGELTLLMDNQKASLRIAQGEITEVLVPGTPQLGELAVAEGYIEPTTLERLVLRQRLSRNKIKLGKLLMEDASMSSDHIRRLLTKQAISAIQSLLHWNDGRFSFDPCSMDGHNRKDRSQPCINTQDVLLAALGEGDELLEL